MRLQDGIDIVRTATGGEIGFGEAIMEVNPDKVAFHSGGQASLQAFEYHLLR
jgi:hypothetical protein